jgi:MoaA/NifB/PqqE/SkfB family radical SAM enzyme
LEGSHPTADRLSYLTLADVEPLVKESIGLGVKRFSFTGGEPFLNPAFMDILDLCLDERPCLVLTNATKPLEKKLSVLGGLARKRNELKFRVSLDSPDHKQHDLERGDGAFAKALEGIKALQALGFSVSVAAHWPKGDDLNDLRARYEAVLKEHAIRDISNIVFFPDFLLPNQRAEVPEITEDCMTRYQDEVSRSEFMCAFSRMVIKRGDRVLFSACTLVDDDEDYDSEHLEDSLTHRVMLKHHRCFSCFSCGSSCSEGA